MNFVKKILDAGFVEVGQKWALKCFPQKEKWIPKW